MTNPIEPPVTEESDTLPDFDHENAGDDSAMHTEEGDPGDPEAADHPANPATYPIPPKETISEFVELTVEEIANKSKVMVKKMVEVESLKEERADLNGQIKKLDEEIAQLRDIINSGRAEVPVGQGDLFRQPVGPREAAKAFEEMASEAKKAAGLGELSQTARDAAETTQGLNAMAETIQAEQGIEAPGPGFLNDIENHKAKMAQKRKGKK